ncbi:MAG: hypothetical protein HRT67_00475, partial [Flavobacteriaceae bacterium]|nr:hypothetical protein [Flavobacteriaceae bacterium]
MQLKQLLFGICFLSFNFLVIAQETIKQLPETEADILYNYYEQDGNNAAVTGGIGTEELKNSAPLIIFNIPLNENSLLGVTAGIDYYTSASSANVDKYSTGASSDTASALAAKDSRAHFALSYTELNEDNNTSLGFNAGYSKEYDVTSINFGADWSKSYNNDNQKLSIKANVFIDRWLLIYPGEIRNSMSNDSYDDDDDDD